MPVSVSPTPNPNAVKFTVGVPVGGPTTYLPGGPIDDPLGSTLVELPGVTSVFLTADFITINKLPDAAWESIIEPARQAIAEHFELH